MMLDLEILQQKVPLSFFLVLILVILFYNYHQKNGRRIATTAFGREKVKEIRIIYDTSERGIQLIQNFN